MSNKSVSYKKRMKLKTDYVIKIPFRILSVFLNDNLMILENDYNVLYEKHMILSSLLQDIDL